MIESGAANATQEPAVEWLRAGRRFVQAVLVIEGEVTGTLGLSRLLDRDVTRRAQGLLE